MFPGLQTLVATAQNLVTAVNGLSTFLRKVLNNVPGPTVIGNPATGDGTLSALTALQLSTLLLGAEGEIVLTDMAVATPNFSDGSNFFLALTTLVGASRTLANPIGAIVGQSGYIRMKQDATGGESVVFGSRYQASGGVASLSPTTTANAVNIFEYQVVAGPAIVLRLLANVEH